MCFAYGLLHERPHDKRHPLRGDVLKACLLYTSDAADD